MQQRIGLIPPRVQGNLEADVNVNPFALDPSRSTEELSRFIMRALPRYHPDKLNTLLQCQDVVRKLCTYFGTQSQSAQARCKLRPHVYQICCNHRFQRIGTVGERQVRMPSTHQRVTPLPVGTHGIQKLCASSFGRTPRLQYICSVGAFLEHTPCMPQQMICRVGV